MGSDLDRMKEDWLGRIEAAADLPALETVRVAALGKQGAVTGLLKTLGAMSPEERQAGGPRIHGLREAVTEALRPRQAGPAGGGVGGKGAGPGARKSTGFAGR